MNYEETLEYIYKLLPIFQRVGKAAYKADLDNIVLLCDLLGNPQNNFKSIHIAGTNGKGSTSHITASVLQEAGYKVGLYTSPHLLDFRERIKINGQDVSKEFVIDFVERIKDEIPRIKPSFFEITVAMAFDYFSLQKVDVAVVETGLGGRLDSTNIITPVASCITNIGIDHTNLLGNTIEKIAWEKAGIIKNGVPTIIGESLEETATIFKQKAAECKSKILFADKTFKVNSNEKNWYKNFVIKNLESYAEIKNLSSELIGNYQKKNIATAFALFSEVKKVFTKASDFSFSEGIKNVVKNTNLLGRWQVISEQPLTICDTAHNVDGITQIVEQLKNINNNDIHFVFGMVEDKDVSAVVSLLPNYANYHLCKPSIERGLKIEKLSAFFSEKKHSIHNTVSEAYNYALENVTNEGLIYIGGSTFVVADFLDKK